MSKSSAWMLISIIVGIFIFFGWQININRQLHDNPTACSGGRYNQNSCPIGAGCLSAETASTPGWNPLYVPTTREETLAVIDDTKARGALAEGQCFTWVDLATGSAKLPARTE